VRKRIFFVIVIFVLIISNVSMPAAAGNFTNFQKINIYAVGQFTDVPNSEWYASNVQLAYEYGLIHGKSPTTFEPSSFLTIAEAIKLAVCLHSIYHNGYVTVTNGDPWYGPYVYYAISNDIISPVYANYEDFATRADFAVIFANALPDDAFGTMNRVADYAVLDVPMNYSYSAAVYKLYRAGILTGSDEKGLFLPGRYITRSEVAAIVTRMANPDYRRSVVLG